ncbi:MAG TPA: hypothetical protein VHY33_03040 [Thermoanaerobaculia bacterium]|nr:hypothetical protein [Thermoanaerobaculia bacterium]
MTRIRVTISGCFFFTSSVVGWSGIAYSRAEVYQSGVVTLPLQKPDSHDRLTAMNRALADYGDTVRKRSAHPAAFVPFEHMPGNSADPHDESACWKPLPTKPAGTM